MSSRRRRDSRGSRSSSNSRTRSRPRYSPSASGARSYVRRDRDDVLADRRWKEDRERGRERFDERNRAPAERERFSNRRSASRSRSRSLRRSRSRSRSRYIDRRDERRPAHVQAAQSHETSRRETADRGNDSAARWNQRPAKDSANANERGASNSQKLRKPSQKVAVASCRDWEAYLSSTGKAYFYNTAEQRSTWTKPAEWTLEADEKMNAAIARVSKQDVRERPAAGDRDRDRERERERDRDWRNGTRRRSAERPVQRARERERNSRERQSPRNARNQRAERDSRERERPARPQRSGERGAASDAESSSSSLMSSSPRSASSNSMSRSRSSSPRSAAPSSAWAGTRVAAARDALNRSDSRQTSENAEANAARPAAVNTAAQRFSTAANRSVPQSPTPGPQNVTNANVHASPNVGNANVLRSTSCSFAQPQSSCSSPNVAASTSTMCTQNNQTQSHVNQNAGMTPNAQHQTTVTNTAPAETAVAPPTQAQQTVDLIAQHIAAVMQATALPEFQSVTASLKEAARYYDERLISPVVEALASAIAMDKAADALSQRSRERDEASCVRLCAQLKVAETRSRAEQFRLVFIDSRIAEYKASSQRSLTVHNQPTSTGW